MPTATDTRSNWLRRLAPVVGGVNRQLRTAASRLEHTRIYNHTGGVVADWPAEALSSGQIERLAQTLEYAARELREYQDWLTGPRRLTAHGEKVAARFAEEDVDGFKLFVSQ